MLRDLDQMMNQKWEEHQEVIKAACFEKDPVRKKKLEQKANQLAVEFQNIINQLEDEKRKLQQ